MNPPGQPQAHDQATASHLRWLEWCQRLQAIAQNGLTFATDSFDLDRYQAVRQIAAEMLANASNLKTEVILRLLEKDTGYATPKVDVRGVIFREGKLLLVREISDGGWTLPVGWADVCASPAENVKREILEESGFVVRASKILAVLDRSKHPHEPPFAFHVYKLFVQCELVGGQATVSSETDSVGFFGEPEIPKLSATRVTPAQIRRMFEHHRHPELPADFDLTGTADTVTKSSSSSSS
jgi:ADP-ribose pyrophosphatase YjhB (NUDIX family)